MITTGSVGRSPLCSAAPISARPRSTNSANRRLSSAEASVGAAGAGAGAGACAGRDRLSGGAGLQRDVLRRGRLDAGPEARGPQAAQRVVEGRDVARLRVVGGQAQHLVVAEDVGCEPLEGALGTDLDEDARAVVVEGAQALDELHGRGDLAREHIQHLLLGRRVQLAVDVGDDRQRRLDAEPLQRGAQRDAGAGHDLGVEGVADRQRERVVAALLQRGDRAADGIGRAAQHDLLGRVDVGEDDVAVDRGHDLLDLRERRHHGGHGSWVLGLQVGHLAPTGAHGLQRGSKVSERPPPARRTRRASGP